MEPHNTALITGATRGIGRALAAQLAERGFRLFLTGRDHDLLRQAMSHCNAAGMVADLAEPEAVLDLYAAARDKLGQIDVLVNNAGFNTRKAPIAETSLQEFEAQYAVNLRAPYLLCREAMRDMAPRRSGHIVNVISTCAKATVPNMGVYSAMKYALHGLTGALIKEGLEHNVKVTAVYPGGTDTDFREAARPQYMRPESAALMVMQAITAPADVVVHEITYRPICETNF